MNIVYIAVYDNNPYSGVTKKLIAQVNALNSLGIEAILVLFSKSDAPKFEYENVRFEDFPGPPYKSSIDKLKAFFSLTKSYERIFKSYSNNGNTIFLIRNYYPFPSFYRLISSVQKRNKIVIDVVSNTIQESEIRKSNPFYKFLLKYYSSKIANVSTLITGVTEEIIKLNFPFLNPSKPTLAIGNGFDIASVPLNPIGQGGLQINFILVAHLSRWHGLDRLIRGYKKYVDSTHSTEFRSCRFNIVGKGPALNECIELVNKLGVDKEFIFHGEKNGKELDDIFAQSDIAIGNLGTHRKNIKFTSPLKSKEYCSRGIPFFYSCIDLDFIDFSFSCVVNADEDPLNFNEIIDFWDRVRHIENYNVVMREYAEHNLTWKAKMKPLKTMLSNLTNVGTE